MSSPMIVAVAPGSPGAVAGLAPGDEVARIDGHRPRDIIEWQFATDAADIELDIVRGGIETTVAVAKREGEPLGVEIQ
jgi:predicted metalloprotease with PDZ domain